MNKMQRITPVGLKQKSKPSARPRKKPTQDLREWLSYVDGIGELVRVSKPVDRDEEMSAISYLVAKQKPSPAVLFDCAGVLKKVRSAPGICGIS